MFVLEEYGRGAVSTTPACEFADVLAPVLASWHAGDLGQARSWFNLVLPLIRFGAAVGYRLVDSQTRTGEAGLIESVTVRPQAVDADPSTVSAPELVLSDLGIS